MLTPFIVNLKTLLVEKPDKDKTPWYNVRYTDLSTNMNEQCHICYNFIGPDRCKTVLGPGDGSISPIGWCERYARGI